MRRTPKPWDRELWGVVLVTPTNPEPILLGQLWLDELRESVYDGEPSRALLFASRFTARAWCQERQARHAKRVDRCRHWRFRPVRVRETVRMVR